MTFNDFIHKYKLKTKATSNLKFFQVLSSIGLDSIDIFLGDGPFKSDIGIVNLHPSKGNIGFAMLTKTFLIVMVVHLLKNYLNLL